MIQERQPKDRFLQAQLKKSVKEDDIEKIDLILKRVMEHYAKMYTPRFIGKKFGKRNNHRRVPDLEI